MIHVPYSFAELKAALTSIDDHGKSSISAVVDKFGLAHPFTSETDAEIRAKLDSVAKYHGLSLKTLLGAHNFKVLIDEHDDALFLEFVAILCVDGGVTEEQSWAVAVVTLSAGHS